MSVLWLLIGLGMLMAAAAALAFYFANRDGQFDDLERPGAQFVFADKLDDKFGK